MDSKTVSLVIGTYNPRLEWLENALKSSEGLFNETIVVDDGSDPVVSLATHRHETNTGFYTTRNTGCNAATSEWIASLDDDDEFIRENVELLKKFLETTDADIVSFPIILFGDQFGTWGHNPNMDDILNNNQIPSGSWFKKSVFEKLRGFNFREGEDWDFWARAHKHGFKFTHFQLPVYRHRIRKDSLSAKWVGDKFLEIRNNVRKNYEKKPI